MREKKYSKFSLVNMVKENPETWKLRKEQKLKSKLQRNIITVLNLMTVLKCALRHAIGQLKRCPFACRRAPKVPF